MIRKCSDEEALKIVKHPSVIKHLDIYPEGFKDVEKYIIDSDCLAVVIPQGKSVEVHIACPYRSRAGMKQRLIGFLHFIRLSGYTSVFTTAPTERKALTNMLKNLGFQKDGNRWSIVWE